MKCKKNWKTWNLSSLFPFTKKMWVNKLFRNLNVSRTTWIWSEISPARMRISWKFNEESAQYLLLYCNLALSKNSPDPNFLVHLYGYLIHKKRDNLAHLLFPEKSFFCFGCSLVPLTMKLHFQWKIIYQPLCRPKKWPISE